MKNDDALLDINFDQYQRYRILKDIIEIIRNSSKNKSLTILDVGGYSTTSEGKPWLPIKEFLPGDNVLVIDVPSCNIPDYIRGSGENLPFKRGSFDIVSCQDVLEHIPREKREKFICNLIETSGDFLIIGGPFYSENSALAEKIFFQFIKDKLGIEHTHLKEHLVNGLPLRKDIEQILDTKKLNYSIIPNLYLNNWLLMNLIKVYIASIPNSLHSMIDRFYNLSFYESDQRETAYRNIIVISKKGDMKTLERISKKFKALQEKYKYFSFEKADFSLLQLLLSFKNLGNDNTISLTKQIYDKDIHIKNLETILHHKDLLISNTEAQLKDIENSRLWNLFIILRKTIKMFRKTFYKEKQVSQANKTQEKEHKIDSAEDQYTLWLKKNTLSNSDLLRITGKASNFTYKPTISIIMPVYNVEKVWLEKAMDSMLDQVYTNWELCIADDFSTEKYIRKVLKSYKKKDSRIKVKYLTQNQGIALASNEAISLSTGEFIGLLDHDDKLAPNALYEVAKLLQKHPEADMIYSDEDKITARDERHNPFFKPGWSPDLFLSQMYTRHFGVYRKEIINRIGGFREGFVGSKDYDLVLRFTEKTDKIYHIPKILYHGRVIPGSTATEYSAKSSNDASLKALSDALNRRSIKGHVEIGIHGSLFRVKRDLLNNPFVSIIIPTKDKPGLLKKCVDSIREKTDYDNYQIVIVDNNSSEADTINYLNEQAQNKNVKILPYKKPFNFSAINNYAVSKTESDVVVFLNNDIEVISSEWLSAMLEHIQREEVGAVGAKLLFHDNSIQHAGVVLGVGSVAGHAFKDLPKNINHHYFGHADAIRNCSALTGACLMVKRTVFEEIGGFDEINLPIAFNDIDFCLRLREKGYLIIYTPYAILYHHESVSRGFTGVPDPEAYYVLRRWKDRLYNDPYYNVNLTLEREDFSLNIETYSK